MKIAVTGLNNVDSPAPGVPVIRGIKEGKDFDGQIVGLLYDALEPGAYMNDLCSSNYLMPYPSSGLEAFLNRIKVIHAIEKIDVIIPTLDAELFAFVKLESDLLELGIKTFLPTTDQLNLRAKDKLGEFCENNNIKAPKTFAISSIEELYKIPSKLSYPMVIKGIFYDAYIANNFDEALAYFHKVSYKWGLPIVVQEFLRGDEYNVVAVGDGNGAVVGAVPMKKLYITDKGKAWSGVTIDDPELLELTDKIIKSLNWKSGCELEFVKKNDQNEYYLIEINPRLPAWVYLSVGAGQNLPHALLQLALNQQVEPMTKYDVGKIFIRYAWDLITDINKFEKISIKGVVENG
ncbi:MAG: ATP-grasp domain-containing protein [Ignavibacteriae bacterium]|nr:ATP-grasp domain-containing protein [Ignavibacteriota bacterium]